MMTTRQMREGGLAILLALMPLHAFTQQLSARASAPRYILRPGDTLNLQYRLTPELNQTVVIQPDGFVSLNVANEIHIGGMTVLEAHDLIVQKELPSLNKPELNLVLEEFTRPSVVIAGEVVRPGQFELKEHTTALGAIFLAGGFTPSAQVGQVLLFRKVNDQMAEVTKLNLNGIRNTARLERDRGLQPGDMIYVPRDKFTKIQRYLQITNLGAYFNPLQGVH